MQQPKSPRLSSRLLVIVAGFSMFVALLCQNITLASPHYGGVLVTAFGCMVLALICVRIVWRRDGPARWSALVITAPSLFILWDLLRRLGSVSGFW